FFQWPLDRLDNASLRVLHPRLRIDEAAEQFVGLDDLANEYLVIPIAKGIHEVSERAGLLIVITFHEQIAGDFDAHELRLIAVHHVKGRIEREAMKVLPEQSSAKAVQRADVELVEE